MFHTMKNYGLGIEEATRALIVRKAFQKEALAVEANGRTTTPTGLDKAAVNAIENLISKVSLDNLLYETDSSADMNSDSEEERLSICPDLQFNPMSSGSTASRLRNMDRKKSKDRKNNNNASAKSKIPTNKATSKSKGQVSSPSLSGRKRKMEDATASIPREESKRRAKNNGKIALNGESSLVHLSSSSSRPRSDSDSSMVDAKIASIHPSTTTTTTASSLRPKRSHRGGPIGAGGSNEDAMASSSEIKACVTNPSSRNDTRSSSA
jgi:hypothetical protein